MDGASKVVIIGGGFAGLYLARTLGRKRIPTTLVDRRNFHLFQPLLYQVATGSLSPGEIAAPLRSVLRREKSVRVLLANAIDLDPARRRVILEDGELEYDILVVATGAHHHYFGNHDWEPHAPGLKTIEQAQEVRSRVLLAFEEAEREPDPTRRRNLLRFVIVGAGPTGVEMAGALAELARATLKEDFRSFDPASAEVVLVEAGDRVLPSFPQRSSERATRSLEALGVSVRVGTRVVAVEERCVTLEGPQGTMSLECGTVLWAAGVQASSWGRILHDRVGAELDQVGRVIVQPDLTVPGHPDLFVLGDLAHVETDGGLLPGLCPVAMQQGTHAGRCIATGVRRPFRYFDKGTMAVIGRGRAVALLAGREFGGVVAWLLWVFVHIAYLIGFDNKLLVMTQWAWNYATNARGTRLVTGGKSDS